MNALRSVLYAFVFYIGSAPYCLAATLIAPFSRRAALGIPKAWAQFQYLCARLILRNRLVVDGVLPSGTVIIAVKHETFFESYELLRLLDKPAVVVKAELLAIPLWGTAAAQHGVIPVSRETGASALRTMLKAARAAVAAGRPIAIFPEGTRTPHGERPPLRPGIAGLYKALGVPIVPIAVDSGRVWGYKSFWKRPGPIHFRVGAPILPGLPRDEVERRVHAAINALNS